VWNDLENSLEKADETKTTGSTGKAPGKRFVPAIIFIVFALSMSGPTLNLLTREIATTFFGSATQETVGITTQLSTISNAVQVAAGIIMGVLAVRFRHKSLLMAGIFLSIIAHLGAYFAPTFLWMQVIFAIGGAAAIMVSIVAVTLLGDLLPLNRKAKAVGYLVTALYLAVFFGSPIVSFLAGLGSWRYIHLLLGLPAAVAALAVSYIGIPSISHTHQPSIGRKKYVRSFRQVLLNKSAVSCLVGSLFFTGITIGLFAINFFRQQFWSELSPLLQAQYASYIIMAGTLTFAVGGLAAGRLTDKFGAKNLTVVGALGDGVFIILLFIAPNFWAALAFDFLHMWFAAMAITTLSCLSLDQVPSSRGTMMSLRNSFTNIGNTIAPAIGGALLVWASYPALGLVLGAMSIIASAIILLMAKDPNRGLRDRAETKIQ
jgi:predicted MFS family arabinose efflux permease